MPEINFKNVDKCIADIKEGKVAYSVYLIYGEEFLYKKVLDELLEVILPQSDKSLNYEPFFNENENISEAIDKLNTYSLFSQKKIIHLCDSRIFYSRQDNASLYEKSKKALEENEIKRAIGFFTGYLGVLNLSIDDVGIENRSFFLDNEIEGLHDNEWLDKMIGYCRDLGISTCSGEGQDSRLQKAIEKGFPKDHYLIITTDLADKRRSLYSAIKEKGLIIDCSVPQGARQADKDIQNTVLNDALKSILSKSKKKMDSAAYMALYEKTGFDLRTFAGNIEKLISYVGDRREITSADVEMVLNRTKTDPIFEITDAISDKNIVKALFLLNSLIMAGTHPLQILAAITNQIRKLILCRSLMENPSMKEWHKDISFNEFRIKIIPDIVEYDKNLLNIMIEWETILKERDLKDEKQKKDRKISKNLTTDLFIAKNPNNAFPVYKLMLKSNHFSTDELISAIEHLGMAEKMLKTSAGEPKTILERAIINIC